MGGQLTCVLAICIQGQHERIRSRTLATLLQLQVYILVSCTLAQDKTP